MSARSTPAFNRNRGPDRRIGKLLDVDPGFRTDGLLTLRVTRTPWSGRCAPQSTRSIPTDPLTFAAMPLLLIAIGVVACYVPARRATRIDPVVAMRGEWANDAALAGGSRRSLGRRVACGGARCDTSPRLLDADRLRVGRSWV